MVIPLCAGLAISFRVSVLMWGISIRFRKPFWYWAFYLHTVSQSYMGHFCLYRGRFCTSWGEFIYCTLSVYHCYGASFCYCVFNIFANCVLGIFASVDWAFLHCCRAFLFATVIGDVCTVAGRICHCWGAFAYCYWGLRATGKSNLIKRHPN
jgi:hypothetical protein